LSCTIFWCKTFLGSRWNDLSKGLTYNDIIQDAFKRACKREWPEITEEKFRKYLFGAIKGIISGLSRSPETKKVDQLVLVDKENEGEIKYKTQENSLKIDPDSEFRIDRKIVLEYIEKEIKGDKDLESVWSGTLIGMQDLEISKISGMPITTVRNCKKRLLRLVVKISKSL
jgi:hypothetical protein